MGLWDLPSNETEAIRFFQDFGILPNIRECTNSHPMKLYINKEKNFWKCNVNKCRQTIRMRVGNWFEGSRISFTTAVRFIYCWCKELTPIKFCQEELHMADKTIIEWDNYLREICVAEMEERKKIGGSGCIVEIDDGTFTKRKNNAGRLLPPQGIFGGICRETKETFLVTVPNRNADTLMREIKENIKEGTTIYSDYWRGYDTHELEEAGYIHCKVNHEPNFVDPQTGCSYLAEFIWRQTQVAKEKDCFEAMLKAIATQFPPEIKKQ